ncbi:MAG: peptidoglycan-binding protein [Variovorax sp.]|nr:peptidoglycan-binding protein [Variovorax sp.]
MQIESGGFSSMNENLRYSGARLLEVFPGRNGMRTAEQANSIAAGGPEKIAEAIYGGEWGAMRLGNTQEGDGWKYHGRGYVQLTGRDNYAVAGKALGLDLINQPELAADRDVAAKIAIHYWETRVVSRDHQTNVTAATRDINGGEKGLRERKAAASAWEDKLAKGYEPDSPLSAETRSSQNTAKNAANLKQGDRGTAVAELQRQLNNLGYTAGNERPLAEDGRFGPATQRALQTYQRDHGLVPDGIAGPKTLDAIRDPAYATQQPNSPTPQIDEQGHPGFGMFCQARTAVHRLDAQHGRVPDIHSDQLSACLAVTALRAGMDRIDHVALGTDASQIFAAQGALNSPFKQLAGVATMEAFNTSIAQSTREWHVASQQCFEQNTQHIQKPELQSQDQAVRVAIH